MERGSVIYFIIVLGDVCIGGSLEGCLKVACTNRQRVSQITGISYDRLTYLFIRKGKSYVVEGGYMIMRTENLYKGLQGGNNKKF
jgi:hypothetical protein